MTNEYQMAKNGEHTTDELCPFCSSHKIISWTAYLDWNGYQLWNDEHIYGRNDKPADGVPSYYQCSECDNEWGKDTTEL